MRFLEADIKIIKLKKDIGGWSAQFVGDPEIVEMFGTDTIPTAFGPRESGVIVQREMQRAHPNHIVIFEVSLEPK